jgi:4-hydroxybenzoate polyprenyltransferase
VLLGVAGAALHLSVAYWAGLGLVTLLFLYEHSLVRPGDLRWLDAAFFTVNGIISVVFLVFVLAESVS